MSDDIRVPLSGDERDRLLNAAALSGKSPEEYAHSLVMEALDGPFRRALDEIRPKLAALAAHEQPEEPRPPVVDSGEVPELDERPLGSRDMADRAA